MNDIQIGDVFAHRTLTIKTPFTAVPFPATYEVWAYVNDMNGTRITLRALHHYKRENLHTNPDTRAWLITELPDPHGEQFDLTPQALEKHFVFLRHREIRHEQPTICEACECPIDPNLKHTEIGSECICDLKEDSA